MKLALLLALLCAACDKKTDAPKQNEEKAKTESAEKEEPKNKEKKKEPKEEEPPSDSDGTPAWSADKGGGKACAASAAAKSKLKALQKGDGDVDGAALKKELVGDCHGAERELAEAINSGGYAHYKKKDYKTANTWWKQALVVKPSFDTARYNLACGLALDGDKKHALAQIQELARATKSGDATAANFLEKAKSDEDLASIRDDEKFKKALEASQGGLVGPRKEPELNAKVVKLLPDDFKKNGAITYKPALLQVWTWRPESDVELLVATAVHDPSTIGQPKGDLNKDYGAILVLKRKGDDVELLTAKKTGESPPSVAGGPNKTVAYSFYEMCGDLRGTLSYKAGKVVVSQKTCEDLGKEETKKSLPKCKSDQMLVADGDDMPAYCTKSCTKDADCPGGSCGQAFLVDEKTGDVFAGVGKSVPACTK